MIKYNKKIKRIEKENKFQRIIKSIEIEIEKRIIKMDIIPM